MGSRLTIGEFATLTHLSVRTLRRYHADGLLEPAAIDPFTNYRYYAPEQIPNAQVIHQLRRLDVPLQEIKRILATDDAGRREEVIAGHLSQLEAELARTQAAVASLRRLVHPEPAEIEVDLPTLPARTVAAVKSTVHLQDSLAWYDEAMAELDAAFPPGERTGPPGGHYANDLFTAGHGLMTVFRPVRTPRPSGRVEVMELPPVELAVTVHAGSHDDIDVTYGRLGAWVATHALAVDGPIQEVYRVGPRDTPTAADWRTEIGWPVFRLSGKSAARESSS
ncbi:MerR family transcriptional regulator [Mycolicibacterium diernhoferi]|uniref:MerR family transcriptional regulator n=1 Tax=Mycolicibacterium diernhoferi TaxID=1801 RepID=A0A1Q4H472_9MYCO|nr:MerR family transcriptional regulator [Mycolicibacterium diernhoferi]OJZ61988.1 MerR family transcriptional regulator [Mycolicibacterium diernhoferi]OPE54326.1 MerR family transcriptional regulator [Mycolicibacterium diernhoferi]PEG51739.1 MerR family transcriptional regulator [Mycolicibacterium diernhoferi]QYL23475.1 MerR family transcriptional regulator [Mycolicibacterium diernhoferi]